MITEIYTFYYVGSGYIMRKTDKYTNNYTWYRLITEQWVWIDCVVGILIYVWNICMQIII